MSTYYVCCFWSFSSISEWSLRRCYEVGSVLNSGHVKTTEQTPSTNEDHELWLRALEKVVLE